MPTAREGDRVKIHFTGMLDDGTVFTSSKGDEPVEFSIGDGSVIKGIEEGVIGMAVGDRRTFLVPAVNAYGERVEALVATIARSDFPPALEAKVGEIYEVKLPGGECVNLSVINITNDTITLDGNHPLAGQQLSFEIELLTIY